MDYILNMVFRLDYDYVIMDRVSIYVPTWIDIIFSFDTQNTKFLMIYLFPHVMEMFDHKFCDWSTHNPLI